MPYGEKAILQVEVNATSKKDIITSTLIGDDVELYSKMSLEEFNIDQVKDIYPIIRDWFLELMGL